MIPRQELRENNVVGHRDYRYEEKKKIMRQVGQIYSLTSMGAYMVDGVGETLVPYEDMMPIPLTPELMKQLGFRKLEQDNDTTAWIMSLAPNQTYMCTIRGGSTSKDIELNSLHELQNAFSRMNGGSELDVSSILQQQ